MIEARSIRMHYENCWRTRACARRWEAGPIWQLPPNFEILEFPASQEREFWTYATCGMSHQMDAPQIEFHLHSPVQAETHVELLTAITHYHLTGEYLNLGHTVNFGRPWLPNSSCSYGLISLPYLDGPTLEWMQGGDQKVRFLWLVPITPGEATFKRTHGAEALEERFESSGFNYLDPYRESVA